MKFVVIKDKADSNAKGVTAEGTICIQHNHRMIEELLKTGRVIHELYAKTWSEAMKKYYEFMGWEKYKQEPSLEDIVFDE